MRNFELSDQEIVLIRAALIAAAAAAEDQAHKSYLIKLAAKLSNIALSDYLL